MRLSNMEELTRHEQIVCYADQVCRGSIIDNTIDALFTAINNEIDALDVPSDMREELFDYINSTFSVG